MKFKEKLYLAFGAFFYGPVHTGNVFSFLRTECIYRHKPAVFSKANEMIGRYIHFYNYEHSQQKDRRGIAQAMPLRLKLQLWPFALSAQFGAIHMHLAAC